MAKHDKEKDPPDPDESDDIEAEVIRDEVTRIFKKHPDDYIAKLEEIGFEYHDDEYDEEELEEAEATPLNKNQEYLVSFFNGDIPLSDETLEIFLEERRSKNPQDFTHFIRATTITEVTVVSHILLDVVGLYQYV